MRGRYLSVLLAVLLLFVMSNVYLLFSEDFPGWMDSFKQSVNNAHDVVRGNPSPKTQMKYYNHGERAPEYDAGMEDIKVILSKLARVRPGVVSLQNYDRKIGEDERFIGAGEIPMTSKILDMYLQLNEKEEAILKKSHEEAMKVLPKSVVDNAFGGRGISMTGGGMYFPMALAAIRWIREDQPDIPIEVFMRNKNEYEKSYCEDIFPSLNVECLVGEEIYGKKLSKKVMSAYALKPLAILASKFDDVYFMDVDSLPLLDINEVFDSKLYKDTGLIITRDYWPRYVSPHFYDIAGIKLGDRARGDAGCDTILQSDRKNAIPGRSSESGQLFVQKSKRIRSLMLAMYYNMFGSVYFPLLMMGGPGEGDKDTYAAAAVVCNETYYQNINGPATLGIHNGDSFDGYVMLQPNPLDDYAANVEKKKKVVLRGAQVHTANYKTNIKYYLNNPEGKRGFPPFKRIRNFDILKKVHEKTHLGVDVELKMFDAMRYTACDWTLKDGAVPRDWEGENVKKYCRILTAYVSYLKNNTQLKIDPQEAPEWVNLYAEGKVPEVDLGTE